MKAVDIAWQYMQPTIQSEAILIAFPATLSKTSLLSFSIPGFLTSTVAEDRNLGLTLDSTVCFKSHIKNITHLKQVPAHLCLGFR